MLGLLQKDFYTIRRQGKIMIFILVFYLIFGIMNDSPSFFLGFLLIFSSMMPLTAMGYDERNQCDKLFLCMPISRRDLVSSRFLLGLILTIVSNLIGVVCSLTVFKEDRTENLLLLGIVWGICLFYFSVCFPIALKFGVEKSRYAMMGLIFLPTILIALLAKQGYLTPVFNFVEKNTTMSEVSILSILIGFIIYLISWFFSMKFYENKEL